ncbi:homocysteine-responsive endoplasmic reticulum-resident ubiquitin-like domain member 2 protein isoform X1 [Polypterus senegalus]|uniref:homocysteine-responsive endoplasmic reticulum-resident ubiquitin-like domain member 2 protein isoform X1 n=1 Tax=Polypterus senegalus TaxID=55291 RepID=UPI0019646684|nr:homocysteine-responsive endoplasmic reticulum-resident ubiquitin-like domain member 2 protein isoform X1 [Polypterus senegalus]
MDHNTVDSPVTLVIKAPNQKYDDQTINCFLNWTVEKLKSHLSKVYPSKPLSKDQRLVYSGKLLPDHLQLRDVLRKQDEYHMVHLVCASRTPPGSPKPGMSKSRSSPESLGTTTLDNSGTSANPETTSESAGSSMEGLRHRSQQLQVSPEQSRAPPYFMQGLANQLPVQPGLSVGFPIYPAYNPVQILWWQQMYARHYYMQYQAATASSRAPTSILPAPPVASQSVAPPPPPPPAQNEPPVLPNAAIPENRPVNQNIQMNAQGGPVINDDDLNRDWLDWMYTFSRAAILLSIVYFYSSFSRFIMVMGAMLLVYLHQAGWFPFRQDVQNPGGDLNAEEQGAEPQQDMQEMERLMDEGLEEDRGNDGLQEANAAQHPGLLALAWSFITTFFTSLIPEGPPNAAN